MVHITDVLAVSMMLGITAQVKEAGVAWDKGEKKSKDPKEARLCSGHGWGQQGGSRRFRGCRPSPEAQQTCPGDPGASWGRLPEAAPAWSLVGSPAHSNCGLPRFKRALQPRTGGERGGAGELGLVWFVTNPAGSLVQTPFR